MGKSSRGLQSAPTISKKDPTPAPIERIEPVDETPIIESKQGFYLDVVLFCTIFAVYARTVYASVPGGDSGELIVASCSLGVPHPPGYPIFAMMGYLFTWIPWGSMAFRVNLFSSLCGALSAVLMSRAARAFIIFSFPESARFAAITSFASAGVMAFAPLFWMYHIQAEVFALNNFFVSLILLHTVAFLTKPSVKVACLSALSVGLSFANQHTIVFIAVPVTVFVFFYARNLLWKPKILILVGACGLCGLLPYLYLVWASSRNTLGAWGDITTLDGFLTHFFRKEYGTFRLYSGNEKQGDMLPILLRLYFKNLRQQTMQALYVAAPVGLLASLRQRGKFSPAGGVIAFAYFFYIIVFHLLANLPVDKPLFFGVQIRFWMQPHIIAFFWIAIGLHALLNFVHNKFSLDRTLVYVVLLAIVAAQLTSNFAVQDQSQNRFVELYGRAHLEALPPKSTLIVKGDLITNSIRYLQVCENVRPDVYHLDQSMMTYEWFVKRQRGNFQEITFPGEVYHPYKSNGYSMQTFLNVNLEDARGLFFLCGGWYHDEQQQGGIPGYTIWPMGMCEHIRYAEDDSLFDEWVVESEKMLPTFSLPDLKKYDEETWENVVHSDALNAMHKRLIHMLNFAIAHDNQLKTLQLVADGLENILHLYDPPPEHIFRNLGIVYGRLAKQEKMIDAFTTYLSIATAPESDLKEIRKIVEDHKRFKTLGPH